MLGEDLSWDDIYVAYRVAELGSLSRAGEKLGLNHSTVLRRINQLEQRLGVKLFIRHQRGYRLTDEGNMMLTRMRPIVMDMQRLFSSLSAQEGSPVGTLRISTVSDFSLFFAPVLYAFREAYPNIRVQVVATDDVLSLAEGEVHVAIRMGAEPREPDLVARPLMPISHDYFASRSYIERHGVPRSMADIHHHLWVLPSGEKQGIPGICELVERLHPDQIVFQSNSFSDIHSAVIEGMGIGPIGGLQRFGNWAPALERVDFGLAVPESHMWFVYHKDMRGSARIRALQDFILQWVPEMSVRINRPAEPSVGH
ncbi:LysR family transcriptional regulator [Parathalassolituus penaei]|uniref:LysR family transcriptional regulator n=1 Tax=Parathalassolituus penaei TaxID=2997323 RepID=A0A9X3EIJ5_9GAMM|nr:LysR family transcriptional regulator [Parathalassolituus penaei]MCY0964936.1 LysR family transcriptional regulator [Parathalassolituus penaei]